MTKDLCRRQELQYVPVREGYHLRPLELSDATAILRVLDFDPTIRQRVTVASRMHSAKDVEREIQAYQSDTEGLIRYALMGDEGCVGLVSLWKDPGYFGQKPEDDSYGFGYFIDPSFRGKGLITDAVYALMTRLVQTLSVRSFIAFSEDDNPSSRSVLLRLGFEPTDETFTEPENGWTERKYIKKVL